MTRPKRKTSPDKHLGAVLGLLPLAILRLLSPIRHYRLVAIRGERIGHLTSELDGYLAERMRNPPPKKVIDLYFFRTRPCNTQVAKMVQRRLPVSGWFKVLYQLMKRWPSAKKHVSSVIEGTPALAAIDEAPQNFHLTAAEIARGDAILRDVMQITNAPVALIFNRDNAYLQTGGSWRFEYHDYRNSPVADMVPMAQYLVSEGYAVVRVGSVVADAFPETPGVFDYPMSGHRSDFMDVYLFHRARFFVGGSSSGIGHLMRLFRKPCVNFNVAPFLTFEGARLHRDLLIPKLYKRQDNGNLMSVKEIVSAGAAKISRTEEFEELGILLANNSTQDILDVTRELVERLDGKWSPHDGDQMRQSAFFHAAQIEPTSHPRIGARFIEKYSALLN